MANGWDRLAAQVRAERTRRGYRRIGEFAEASGLSTTTLDAIEHARKTSYDPGTLATLEHALGWQPGSVERVLRGSEPEIEADPDLRAVLEAWPRLGSQARRLLRILAVEASRVI